jgi:hypothetical protein
MTYPVGTAPQAIAIALGEVGYVEVPDNLTKVRGIYKGQRPTLVWFIL